MTEKEDLEIELEATDVEIRSVAFMTFAWACLATFVLVSLIIYAVAY